MVSKILLIVVAVFNGEVITSTVPYESMEACQKRAYYINSNLPHGFQHHAVFCARVPLNTNI